MGAIPDNRDRVVAESVGEIRANPPRVVRSRDPRAGTFRLLLVLPLAFLLLFLVAPIVFMVLLSVRENLSGQLLAPFEPTAKHYQQLVDTPSFLRLLATSAGIAATVAFTTTVLAFPLAYYLRFRAGARGPLLLFLLLLPFWTSYLLRVVAWRVILGTEGVLNSFLLSTGLIHDPLEGLIYNRGAVIVTLIYVWVPFAAIPILAALQRIRPELHEAAADLYAGRTTQFLRVTLPLSMPGVLAAFFMVFIPTVGEYVAPLLVGGTGGTMYGNLIYDFFTRAANWPFGSALSVVMLLTTLAVTAVALRLVDVRRFVFR